MKGFQGLEGQWKGWSFASATCETVGVAVVVSSSDDLSLVVVAAGFSKGGDVGATLGLTSYKKFLRGDQPGGRRLANP